MTWVYVIGGLVACYFACWYCYRVGYREGHVCGYMEGIADELRGEQWRSENN